MEVIKQDIKKFLEEKLSLELSEDKTLITHGRKSAKFLGHEIYVRKSAQTKRNKAGKLTRPYNNKIYLKMPTEVVRKNYLTTMHCKLKCIMARKDINRNTVHISLIMTIWKFWKDIMRK